METMVCPRWRSSLGEMLGPSSELNVFQSRAHGLQLGVAEDGPELDAVGAAAELGAGMPPDRVLVAQRRAKSSCGNPPR